jgi:SAM-dependent methyltransferase
MRPWQRNRAEDEAGDYAWAPAADRASLAAVSPAAPIDEYISWQELDQASDAWRVADGAPGSPFDRYRGKFLPLPDRYDAALGPLSPEYLAQQDRLWQAMIGEASDYDPGRYEQSGVDESQALVRPGFYQDGLERAGDHIIAMGHIVQRCGLRAGDRVLEYGAGFGQIALTLALLGLTVDTVDIDPGFCSAVQKQADWFGVDLKAHNAHFGENPAGTRYAMILFYEAFHHARNFTDVIANARAMLEPGGKIVMAGEPIEPAANEGFAKICPYPWGMRLDVENAAIVRFRHWYELGFREEFLFETFDTMGFTPRKYPGHISRYATVYSFTLRPDTVLLSDWTDSPEWMAGWHGSEPEGRWTMAEAAFPVEARRDRSRLRITCANYHDRTNVTDVAFGDWSGQLAIESGQDGEMIVPIADKPGTLHLRTVPIRPIAYGIPDTRELGIFVKSIEYLE